MKWVTVAEKLPQHFEQVLIQDRNTGKIAIATFDEPTKEFKLKTGDTIKISEGLFWMQIAPLPLPIH
jgi:hypothetical protein